VTDPQHPAFPPYGQVPQHPQYAYPPQGHPAPAPARRGNPMGLVALIAGILILATQVFQLIGQAVVIRGADYSAIQILNIAQGVIQGLLGLVAVVFGIIGILQKGRPHALAGIGLGIGASAVLGVVTGWLIFPLIAAL
jgi:hypothetical protein